MYPSGPTVIEPYSRSGPRVALSARSMSSALQPASPLRRFLAISVGLALLAGCDWNTQPMEMSTVPADIARFVTGDAARGLNANGLFTLAPAAAPADLPIISAERAGELATAYVRTYGAHLQPGFRMYGAPDIDIARLQLDPRVLYAETPHELFPNVWDPSPRRHLGPYYIAHFLLAGRPALTVAVSPYAHDVGIESNGSVVRPVHVGGLFHHFPVVTDPNGRVRYRPVSPEDAVEMVATRTGALVTAAPRLLLKDSRYHPVTAQWQLKLDRPVSVKKKKGGEQFLVRELFVGPNGILAVPSAVQPAFTKVDYRSGPRPIQGTNARGNPGRGPAPRATLNLPRRQGMAVEFDDVTLETTEG